MTRLYILIFVILASLFLYYYSLHEPFKNKQLILSKKRTLLTKTKDFVLFPIYYPYRIIKKRYLYIRDSIISTANKVSQKFDNQKYKTKKHLKYFVNHHL